MEAAKQRIVAHAGLGLEIAKVQIDWCPVCSEPISDLEMYTTIERREHAISGICDKCQKEIFGDPERDGYYADYCDESWDDIDNPD